MLIAFTFLAQVSPSTEGTTTKRRKIFVMMDLGSDSSNDEDDDALLVSGISDQQQTLKDTVAATNEFKHVSSAWNKYATQLRWKDLYPGLPNEPDLVDDLMTLDLKTLMVELEKVNSSESNKNCFGYLPLMASCSKCQLGALNSQSYAERINSVANLIVTLKRGDLDTVLMNKLVMLRMNETFMEYLRTNRRHGNINVISGIDEIDDNIWSS